MPSLYTYRSWSVFFVFFGIYTLIALNLYIVQIVHTSFYQDLKLKQYQITHTSMPPRAPILDRNNKYLALNKKSIAAFIMPRHLENREQLLAFLAQYFPKSYERFEQYKNHHFMYIQRRLTEEQQTYIEHAGITDIKFLEEPDRFYPVPSLGQLVGLTDIDNKGLFGLELAYNTTLAGLPTTVTLARDARSRYFYFHKETNIIGKQSRPIKLTIDGSLQYLVYQELQKAVTLLQAKEAAALVIDPGSGEILTLARIPDFDPNRPEELDLSIAKNPIITDTHELGSVIKVFAALAALEEGVVTPDEILDCKNRKTAYIDGRKINTVYPGGLLSFSQVIQQSNNIGIAQVAKRIGMKLYDHYCRLGFGKKTGIPFPGEQRGFVNPPELWSKQSLISLSYGYEVRCSLLQLARAFCILAQNGQTVNLKLVLSPDTELENATEPKQLFRPESATAVKAMIDASVRRQVGQPSFLDTHRIMYKTGTANLLIDGKYDSNRNIFTCAGIIENPSSDLYRRVIVVFIGEIPKKNVYAATIAVPVFNAIAEKVVIHDKAL